MRKYLPCFILLLIFAVPVSAQDLPLVDVMLGGGFLAGDVGGLGASAVGPMADINFNLDEKYGIFYSFSYHEALDVDAAIYESLGGLRYFFRNDDSNKTFFVHAMGGGVEVDAIRFRSAWAAGAGVGMDMEFKDKFDLRLFQFDYGAAFFPAGTEHNFRLSTGIVFHFGSR